MQALPVRILAMQAGVNIATYMRLQAIREAHSAPESYPYPDDARYSIRTVEAVDSHRNYAVRYCAYYNGCRVGHIQQCSDSRYVAAEIAALIAEEQTKFVSTGGIANYVHSD